MNRYTRYGYGAAVGLVLVGVIVQRAPMPFMHWHSDADYRGVCNSTLGLLGQATDAGVRAVCGRTYAAWWASWILLIAGGLLGGVLYVRTRRSA